MSWRKRRAATYQPDPSDIWELVDQVSAFIRSLDDDDDNNNPPPSSITPELCQHEEEEEKSSPMARYAWFPRVPHKEFIIFLDGFENYMIGECYAQDQRQPVPRIRIVEEFARENPHFGFTLIEIEGAENSVVYAAELLPKFYQEFTHERNRDLVVRHGEWHEIKFDFSKNLGFNVWSVKNPIGLTVVHIDKKVSQIDRQIAERFEYGIIEKLDDETVFVPGQLVDLKERAMSDPTLPTVAKCSFRFILRDYPDQTKVWPPFFKLEVFETMPDITFPKKAEEAFQELYEPLIIAEFGDHNAKDASHQMGKAHSRKYGPSCNDCFDHLGKLAEDVISPNGDDHPSKNLLSRFVPMFYPLVRKEFPDETVARIANRLARMWTTHGKVANFSNVEEFCTPCTEECKCIDHWNFTFDRGNCDPRMRIEEIEAMNLFRTKFFPLVEAEFGVTQFPDATNFALGAMWRKHLCDFDCGEICNSTCNCWKKLSSFAEGVVQAMIDRQAIEGWNNPLNLTPKSIPTGALFCYANSSLMNYISATNFPSRDTITDCLANWPARNRQLCNDNCCCTFSPENIDENMSLPIAAENFGADEHEPVRCAVGVLGHAVSAQMVELDFDCTEPMGVYFVTEHKSEFRPGCKVISVNPKSRYKDKIQFGWYVVEAKLDHGNRTETISNHRDLQTLFSEGTQSSDRLLVKFECVTPSPKESKNHAKYRQIDWKKSGAWCGKCRSGWDGGYNEAVALRNRKMVELLASLEATRYEYNNDFEGFRSVLTAERERTKHDEEVPNSSPYRKLVETYVHVYTAYWHSRALRSWTVYKIEVQKIEFASHWPDKPLPLTNKTFVHLSLCEKSKNRKMSLPRKLLTQTVHFDPLPFECEYNAMLDRQLVASISVSIRCEASVTEQRELLGSISMQHVHQEHYLPQTLRIELKENLQRIGFVTVAISPLSTEALNKQKLEEASEMVKNGRNRVKAFAEKNSFDPGNNLSPMILEATRLVQDFASSLTSS